MYRYSNNLINVSQIRKTLTRMILENWCYYGYFALTKLETVFAVYVEIMVTRFSLSAQWVKDKTIWTYSFFGNTIKTVIISITK